MAYRVFGRQPFRFDPGSFQDPGPTSAFSFGAQPPDQEPSAQGVFNLRNMFKFDPGGDVEPIKEQPIPSVTQEPTPAAPTDVERPSFPAMSEYMELLQQRPERGKPNFWSKLIGGVGGGTAGLLGRDAFKETNKLMYAPYDRAVGDWEDKLKGYGTAADLEIKKNQAENTWMTLQGNLRNQNSQIQKRMDDTELARQRLEQQQKAQQDRVDQFVMAGWQKINANGKVYMVNPRDKNGQLVDMGDDYTAQTGRINAATAQTNAATNQANAATNRMNAGTAAGNLNLRGLEHQLREELGRANLSLAERRVITQELNAVTAQLRGEAYVDDVQSRIQDRLFKQADTRLNPQAQAAGFGLALQRTLINTPEFNKFVDSSTNRIKEDAADEPDWEEFQRSLNAEFARITGPQGGGAPDAPTPGLGRRDMPLPGAPPTAPVAPTARPPVNPATNPARRPGGSLNFNDLPR